MKSRICFPIALIVVVAFFLAACNDGFEKREEYYSKGKLKSRTTYRKIEDTGLFVKEGIYTFWYLNGKKKEEGLYKDDKPDGVWKSWYANGVLEFEGAYKAGKKEGAWKRWNDAGQLESEKYYESDTQGYVWKEWFANGQHATEGSYKSEKKDGIWRTWYENGQQKELIDYRKGKIFSYKSWYLNGNPKWEENFSEGRDSLWLLPKRNRPLHGILDLFQKKILK